MSDAPITPEAALSAAQSLDAEARAEFDVFSATVRAADALSEVPAVGDAGAIIATLSAAHTARVAASLACVAAILASDQAKVE
jgi:hypothetical protein